MEDPAFLFYPQDFITGTAFMTDDQVGKYIKLLCYQHINHGKLTEQHMLSICSAHDQHILDKFEKDDDGNYYNRRLKQEAEKRKAYSESRRKNALGRNKKTKLKKAATSKKPRDLTKAKSKLKDELAIYLGKYSKDMLNEFYSYWTEPNQSKTHVRYELEKTWDTGRRLGTWAKNDKKFDKSQTQESSNVMKGSFKNKPKSFA